MTFWLPPPGTACKRRGSPKAILGRHYLPERDLVHVSVNRSGGLRDLFGLYPRRLSEKLPRVRIPLAPGDRDAVLDLQAVLERTYEDGAYRDRINYSRPCQPPLSAPDQAWANERPRVARVVG